MNCGHCEFFLLTNPRGISFDEKKGLLQNTSFAAVLFFASKQLCAVPNGVNGAFGELFWV